MYSLKKYYHQLLNTNLLISRMSRHRIDVFFARELFTTRSFTKIKGRKVLENEIKSRNILKKNKTTYQHNNVQPTIKNDYIDVLDFLGYL